MYRTSLDLHGETVDSIDDDRAQDEDGAEDNADDNDIGKVGFLPCL